jgi:hypothetical protein
LQSALQEAGHSAAHVTVKAHMRTKFMPSPAALSSSCATWALPFPAE